MKIKLLKFQVEDIQNINGIIKSVVRNFRTVEIMKGMFKDISFFIFYKFSQYSNKAKRLVGVKSYFLF